MRSFYIQSRIGPHRSKTPEGYLVCQSIPIARTGWQSYKASEIDHSHGVGDDVVHVYRSPAEVFSPATIASFEGKSITSPHPPQFLTSETDAAYAKGHVQNVRRGDQPNGDGDQVLLADLVFKDAMLINMIESGMREELSCGYNCEWVDYDDAHSPFTGYAQMQIRGNHVAVVPTGRAGEGIRVLDHATVGPIDPNLTLTVTKEEPSMLVENVLIAMGWKRPASAVLDSDPGVIPRNEAEAEEAKERAVKRNQDASEEELKKEKGKDDKMEKEEEGATPPDKSKEAKDAAAAADAMERRITRAVGKVVDAKLTEFRKELVDAMDADGDDDKKKDDDDEEEESESEDAADAADCNCDAKDGEAHDKDCPMHRSESEDSELIPVETLTGEEVPKNPIPGADKALDALRATRESVIASGDRKVMDAWNKSYRALRGAGSHATNDGYRRLAARGKGDDVRRAEDEARVHGTVNDRSAEANDFEAAAKKMHRRNPNEAHLVQ